jgi:aprataxin
MKNKKHYNSFHPTRGFFLPFDEVMSWFDAEPSFFKQVRMSFSQFWYHSLFTWIWQKASLKPSVYEPLLKEPLECFRCHDELKNMPKLKEHLQAEFDAMAEQEKQKLRRKRKLESSSKAATESQPQSQLPRLDGDEELDSPERKRVRTFEAPPDIAHAQ